MKFLLSVLVCVLLITIDSTNVFAANQTENNRLIIEPKSEEDTMAAEYSIQSDDIQTDSPVTEQPIKFSDKEFATAGELYNHWQLTKKSDDTSPYPAYICGVFSTDGSMDNLTFAVTKDEAGEAGKNEILALVSDSATVSFTYQSYSYAELWSVQLALTKSLGEETGANTLGIDEKKNVLIIGIDETNENADSFMQECFEQYGMKIVFEQNNGVQLQFESFADAGSAIVSGGASNLMLWCVLAVLVCGMSVMIFYRYRLAPASKSNTKSSATRAEVISIRQVTEMVKESKLEPPLQLDQQILSQIDKL